MKDTDKRHAVKMLKAAGFDLVRQDGRHEMWGHEDGRKVAVPRHRTISPGVMRKIVRIIENK